MPVGGVTLETYSDGMPDNVSNPDFCWAYAATAWARAPKIETRYITNTGCPP